MPKRSSGIKGCKYKTSVLLLLFLTFSVLVANPKKTTLHGGQSRSWSAEQGKENKRRSLAAYPPPIPLTARSEKKKKKSRDASTGVFGRPKTVKIWQDGTPDAEHLSNVLEHGLVALLRDEIVPRESRVQQQGKRYLKRTQERH